MFDEKIEKLFKNKSYKLATIKNINNSLIYVNDLKAWEKDTSCGEYEESLDRSYKMIVIMVEGTGFNVSYQSDCTGRYYGLKSILSDYNNPNNNLNVGATLNDLKAFVECVRGTSYIYVPYEFVSDKNVLKRKDLKLCYVEDGVAYFTNNPEQWGDDWNDSPYQHNAGTPYKEEGYEITKLGFYTGYIYSEPMDYFISTPLSVEQINHKIVPWLIPEDIKYQPIFAGESIKDFVKKIKAASGIIMYNLKFENYNY